VKQLKARLARMEESRGVTNDRTHLRFCFQVSMNARPGIELVRPEDTDETTYAGIEKTRAGARGDWALHDRLEAEFPDRLPPCPPEVAAGSPAAGAAWLTRVICQRLPTRRAAVQKAIETAERRIEREQHPPARRHRR
jgi:hypothetical protein